MSLLRVINLLFPVEKPVFWHWWCSDRFSAGLGIRFARAQCPLQAPDFQMCSAPRSSLLVVRALDRFIPMCGARLKSCLPAAPPNNHLLLAAKSGSHLPELWFHLGVQGQVAAVHSLLGPRVVLSTWVYSLNLSTHFGQVASLRKVFSAWVLWVYVLYRSSGFRYMPWLLNISILCSSDFSSAHVFILLIFQLKEKRKSTWPKPRSATQQEKNNSVEEGQVKGNEGEVMFRVVLKGEPGPWHCDHCWTTIELPIASLPWLVIVLKIKVCCIPHTAMSMVFQRPLSTDFVKWQLFIFFLKDEQGVLVMLGNMKECSNYEVIFMPAGQEMVHGSTVNMI